MIPLLAIPTAAKFAIATTLAAALFCSGLYMGHKWGVSSCYEATIEAQRHTVETGIQQAMVSDQTITKYVDRVQIVQGKSREIIKEVKIYVKDDTCNLPASWRMLHDGAVKSELSDPTRIVDEGTVSLETATKIIFENYEACHVNSETLSSLQRWVRDQSAIR